MAKLFKLKKGFATLEAIVALGLLAGVSASVFSLVFLNQTIALHLELKQQGLFIAESELKEAELKVKNDFNTDIDKSYSINNFQIKVTGEYVSNWVRDLKAEVTFAGGEADSRFLAISEDAYVEGDDCALSFKSSWENASVFPGNLNLSSNVKATGLDVKGKYIYITADSATQSAPDFFVVDVSVPESPHLVASLNTGPGLGAVKVVSGLAYVTNLSSVSQLQIINVSNPASPFLVYSYVTGSGQPGRSLFYSNKKIYLGTDVSAGKEFYILDVSDPHAPQLLGLYEIGTSVNRIRVFRSKAFVVSPSEKQIRALNVTNPSEIIEVAAFLPTGTGILHGTSIYQKGNRIYFGRDGLTGGTYSQIYSLEFRDENSFAEDFSADINTSVDDIFERDGLVFLATNDSLKEFQIWQEDGTILHFKTALNLASRAVSLDCSGENFFVATEDSSGFVVIKPHF